MILGKRLEDWCDIYCLIKFYGKNPKSIKDLFDWNPPQTPKECLRLGLDLIEARKIDSKEAAQWYENLLKEFY